MSVVVTGMGAFTAAGKTVEDAFARILQGQTGLHEITDWDSSGSYRLVGKIQDYKPRELISDRKLLRVISRQDVLGIHAAQQAIDHSGVADAHDPDRTGVYVGSPGNKFPQQYDFVPLIAKANGDMKTYGDELFQTVNPMWLLRILPNNVLAYVGIHNQFKGPNQNITNHAVSGAQAILEARKVMMAGEMDRAVVVAYDSEIDPHSLQYYQRTGLMSQDMIRPFDAKRDGTLFAEGAGSLMLETRAAAQQRGAKIYGEILGGATTSEAQGMFSLCEDGRGLKRAIDLALERSGCANEDIAMIAAHGNGNVQSDAVEAHIYKECFGQVPVTSYKWALGHTLAAAGCLSTLLTLRALRKGVAPGIATLNTQADDCAGISVSADPQDLKGDKALVVTRGFGSVTTVLVVGL